MGAAIQKHKRGFLTHSSGWHCETVPSPPVPAGTQRSGSPRPAAAAGRIGLRAPVSPHSVHAGSSGQLPGTDLRVLLLPGAALPVGRLFPARSGSSCRAGLQGWLSCSRGASWCGRHVQAQLSSAQLHAAAFWAVTSRTLWFTVSRESVLSSTHHWTPTAVIQDKLQLHLCRAVVRWKHRSLRAHGRKQS